MRSGNGRGAEGGPGWREAGPWAEEAPEPRLVLTPPRILRLERLQGPPTSQPRGPGPSTAPRQALPAQRRP